MPDLRAQQPLVVETGAAEVVGRALSAIVHIDIVVPRTNIRGKLRLVSRRERLEIVAELRAFLTEKGFQVDSNASSQLLGSEAWNYELAARMFSVAVRDPEDPSVPLATIDEWRDCDDAQLDAMWDFYEAHNRTIDPLASGELSRKEVDDIVAAAKKGDASLLMFFGLRRLALFVITSVSPHASSPTSES
jgi:hypothetical protein